MSSLSLILRKMSRSVSLVFDPLPLSSPVALFKFSSSWQCRIMEMKGEPRTLAAFSYPLAEELPRLLEDCWSVKIQVTSRVDVALAINVKTSLRCT